MIYYEMPILLKPTTKGPGELSSATMSENLFKLINFQQGDMVRSGVPCFFSRFKLYNVQK